MVAFPSTPTPGQQFTANGSTWKWVPPKWTALGSGVITGRSGHNVYYPEDFGAVGNTPGHDDAPAIEAAIAAAVAAGMADGSRHGEVILDAGKCYYAIRAPIANPTINGSPTYSYGQINLPYVDSGYAGGVTAGWPPADGSYIHTMFNLVIRGSAPMHVPCVAENFQYSDFGARIRSTYTGGGYSLAAGNAFLIAGTNWEFNNFLNPAHGLSIPGMPYGLRWSAICPIVEDINILMPRNSFVGALGMCLNPSGRARNFRAVANPQGVPTTGRNVGIWFPYSWNMNSIIAENVSISGFYVGVVVHEHLAAGGQFELDQCVICYVPADGSYGNYIGKGIFQYSYNYFAGVDFRQVNPVVPIFSHPPLNTWPGIGALAIGQLCLEHRDFPMTFVNDPNNRFQLDGFYGYNNAADNKAISASEIGAGGARCRLVNQHLQAGPVAPPPAIPANNTRYRNPYDRDAWISITGGTMTAINIRTGTTGTDIQVGTNSFTGLLPINGFITLTYSAAPSWSWSLF